MRATAVLSRQPHTRYAPPSDRERRRAGSLHPGGQAKARPEPSNQVRPPAAAAVNLTLGAAQHPTWNGQAARLTPSRRNDEPGQIQWLAHRQIRALVSLRATDSGVGIVRFGTAPGGHAGDRVASHITWISGRQFLTAVTVGDSRRWPYASWRPSRRAYRRQREHEGDAAATAGHAAIGGLCPQRQRVGPRGLGGGGRRGGVGPPGAGPGCPVAGRVAGGGNDCPASWAAVLARWAGRAVRGVRRCAAVRLRRGLRRPGRRAAGIRGVRRRPRRARPAG